jgi:cyclopropane fatty-acyl-phospholipid synthase-like methyltransferase
MPGIDGFWAFSLWRFPALGKTYDQLTQEEREGLDDHWAQLRTKVQEFFRRKWMQDQ